MNAFVFIAFFPFGILFVATPAMGSTFRRDWSRNGYFELTLCSTPTNENGAVRAKMLSGAFT
jgi:hypothetical protein